MNSQFGGYDGHSPVSGMRVQSRNTLQCFLPSRCPANVIKQAVLRMLVPQKVLFDYPFIILSFYIVGAGNGDGSDVAPGPEDLFAMLNRELKNAKLALLECNHDNITLSDPPSKDVIIQHFKICVKEVEQRVLQPFGMERGLCEKPWHQRHFPLETQGLPAGKSIAFNSCLME